MPGDALAPPRVLAAEGDTFDVTFLGDTYFGEYYQERREVDFNKENYIKSRGYPYFIGAFARFLGEPGFTIVNFEAALCRKKLSALDGRKSWILRGEPDPSIALLTAHGVRAVALGNNHAADFGPRGVTQSIDALERSGVSWFGAGPTAAAARRPLSFAVDVGGRRVPVHVISAYQIFRWEKELGIYATGSRAGVGGLDSRLVDSIAALRTQDPDGLIIVFPHWGQNYAWRSADQATLADRLIAAGVDLIIGHGAHMMQEIEQRAGHWVVHSLGNFIFNSDGEYAKRRVPSFSLVARLRIAWTGGRLGKALRLYPIQSNNQITAFRPRFVDDDEFHAVSAVLRGRCVALQGDNPTMTTGRDEHGPHFLLALDA